MGHSLQAVCMLVHAGQSVVAVPLAARIHEGTEFCNRHKKTLLDKMLILIGVVSSGESFYFVADAYYAAGKIVDGMLKNGNHLITRVKANTVAYIPHVQKGPKKKGRPRLYGKRIELASLLKIRKGIQQAASPVYGEQGITVHYVVRDLLWQPVGRVVRFVAVTHPTRGSILLMSTDTTLDAVEIIRTYGLRFKIEFSFKQAVHRIGSFAYHFWMKPMTPLQRRNGTQYLHRKPLEYREAVKRKVHAYHVFIQAGVIAQGMLQYLSAAYPNIVWNSFGSWLRTIRPGIAPSEFVVAETLRNSLPHFLLSTPDHSAFAKFITQRQDLEKMETFRTAA
ncbi:MAG TPA: transposase, partial [Burkholderiaceae bacterium]|nr:transposase [Burkholderiaceae bacterium]